jgi:hypothetical protein
MNIELHDLSLEGLKDLANQVNQEIYRRENASIGMMLIAMYEHGEDWLVGEIEADEDPFEDDYGDYFTLGETDEGEIEGYYDDEPFGGEE